MKAVILNSGVGRRMGDLTSKQPKCMTQLSLEETILSRQLKQLKQAGIQEIVITTGPFSEILIAYCDKLNLSVNFTFIHNPLYDKTNYIYSIFLARDILEDDILLLHGDLVFEDDVLRAVLEQKHSCMTVSSTLPLPEKDFKAVKAGNRIDKIGVGFFENAFAAQPLYKLCKKDWIIWLTHIMAFCNEGKVNCYAENAFNEVSGQCFLLPFDVKNALCNEIDTLEDLRIIQMKMEGL